MITTKLQAGDRLLGKANGIIQCDTSKGIRYLDIESKEIYTEAELMAIIERRDELE